MARSIPASATLKSIPLRLSSTILDGDITVLCANNNGSWTVFPSFFVDKIELQINKRPVPLLDKQGLLNLGDLQQGDVATLSIYVLNFNKESRLRDEVHSKFREKMGLKPDDPIEEADSWNWSSRIATPDNPNVFSARLEFYQNKAETIRKIVLTPDLIGELKDTPAAEICLHIEGSYTAEFTEDLFRVKLNLLGASTNAITEKLASTPFGKSGYLIPVGGSIKNAVAGVNTLRTTFQLEISRNSEISDDKAQWSSPMLQELFRSFPGLINDFRLDQLKDKNQVVTFLFDNVVKVSAPIDQLTSIENHLESEAEDKMLSDIETSLETGGSISVSGKASIHPIGFEASQRSDAQRKEAAKKVFDTLRKYRSELRDSAEGKVTSVVALDIENFQNFVNSNQFSGRISFSNFTQITMRTKMDPFSFGLRTKIYPFYNTIAFDSLPVGFVVPFAGMNPPSPKWLPCNGNTLKSSDYPELYTVIGTVYGDGGQQNDYDFNLPDYRGRTTVCSGDGPNLSSRNLGDKFGTEKHTLSIAQLPSHNHGGVTLGDNPVYRTFNVQNEGGDGKKVFEDHITGRCSGDYHDVDDGGGGPHYPVSYHTHNIQAEGGSQAFSIVQPSAVLHYLIKVL